jgi:hypothetical protein
VLGGGPKRQKLKHPSVELEATQPGGVGAVGGAFERRETIMPAWVTCVSFLSSSMNNAVRATFTAKCPRCKARQVQSYITPTRDIDAATIDVLEKVTLCYVLLLKMPGLLCSVPIYVTFKKYLLLGSEAREARVPEQVELYRRQRLRR